MTTPQHPAAGNRPTGPPGQPLDPEQQLIADKRGLESALDHTEAAFRQVSEHHQEPPMPLAGQQLAQARQILLGNPNRQGLDEAFELLKQARANLVEASQHPAVPANPGWKNRLTKAGGHLVDKFNASQDRKASGQSGRPMTPRLGSTQRAPAAGYAVPMTSAGYGAMDAMGGYPMSDSYNFGSDGFGEQFGDPADTQGGYGQGGYNQVDQPGYPTDQSGFGGGQLDPQDGSGSYDTSNTAGTESETGSQGGPDPYGDAGPLPEDGGQSGPYTGNEGGEPTGPVDEGGYPDTEQPNVYGGGDGEEEPIEAGGAEETDDFSDQDDTEDYPEQ